MVLYVFPSILLPHSMKPTSQIFYANSTNCSFAYPNKPTVVLRMDDVQKFAFDNASIAIISDVAIQRNLPMVVGVIPNNISADARMTNYLISVEKNPKVEIDQHGTYHTPNEWNMTNMTYNQTLALMELGNSDLVTALGVHPITFVPPYDAYDSNALRAMNALGFKVVSASQGDNNFTSNVTRIGYTIAVRETDENLQSSNNSLASTNEIINGCESKFKTGNICVILIHPQDYIVVRNGSYTHRLNTTSIAQFNNMLDGLQALNVSFGNFKDMVKCN
ncbi:MAG: DUF2334 domain-containing protein [Candidatus Micrarchaeota archaeon]|nr:DUF2334 domain-containing protein [Candidatus Micrarchaeota archaeon]